MNDEIKGILDKLKDNDWYEELDLTGTKWIELKQEETNQLLNYITNLQEEKEDYKSRCEKANEYIKKNTHEYKMFYEELGHFSNLTNISIDKNNKVFIDDLLKIIGGDEE